jgi:hypothetical protein
MNITIDMTSNYEITFADSGKKTNPNKPNFGPISRVAKPKQSQFIVSLSNLFKSNYLSSLII